MFQVPCCVALSRKPREQIARDLIAAKCFQITVATKDYELAGWTRSARPGDAFLNAQECQNMQALLGLDSVGKLFGEIWRIAEDLVASLVRHEFSIEVGTDGDCGPEQIVLIYRSRSFYAGD